MKAALSLLPMHGNKVFHPDHVGKMPRGLQSSVAAGDGLWAGVVGLKILGNTLRVTG